ncbi:MobF family relaxase [Nocardiopsis baichengensis]|uniref:MobF family relaxase n=1 Tax=Nocardiopsis baichengensis TaxID=280240 RepID=UPI00034C2B61|nr:MobF family relaxase [Nocardiopsis baichengensis]
MVFSVGRGYDWRYLDKAVQRDRENYYQSAVREQGEPPGKWHGKGAEALGLAEGSEVTTEVMQALYEGHYDIRDPRVFDQELPDAEKPRLGRKPAQYKSADEIFQEKLKAEPEATAERREQLLIEARKEERKALAFFDGAASPPKSYTLTHAGLLARAKEAREAGDLVTAEALERAAGMMIEVLEEASQTAVQEWTRLAGWTRVGYHGKQVGGSSTGRWMEAGGWVSASFVQHTSRNGDPQLHVHNPVLNRQLCPDGKWRSLDGQAMLRARPQVGAVFDRGLVELSARKLGLRWEARADGQGWEVVGVDIEQIIEFSSRRAEVVDGLEQLIQAYEAKHGYAPNALAVWKMAQFVTKDTKSAKKALSEIPTVEEELEAWEAQTTRAEVDSLASIPGRALFQVDEAQLAADAEELAQLDMGRVIEAALADVQREKPSFTRYELARAISRHLPTSLGGLPAQRVGALLEELTEQALHPADVRQRRTLRLTVDDVVEIPADRRLADGRSVYRDPTAERWTTPDQLDKEQQFITAAVQTGAPAAEADLAAELLGFGPAAERANGVDQGRAAAGRERPEAGPGLDHGVPVADSAAPAPGAAGDKVERPGSAVGRGRSGMEQARSDAEHEEARQYLASLSGEQAAAVYGITTSGRRIDVLEGYAGSGKSRTVSRLAKLWRATTDGRTIGLTTGQNAAGVLQREGLDQAYNITRWLGWIDGRKTRLQAGDLVVVDEGSMVTTDHMARIREIAEEAGAKVLLTGDTEQLSAPGAGGLMRLLAQRHGSYKLTQVRRFHEEWEREASKRLRAGDQEVLAEYDRRGRIRGGTHEQMAEGAVDAFAAAHLRGLQSIVLASSNEDAAELAGRVRERLVELGKVAAEPIAGLHDGNAVAVGDRITARKNNRKLRIGEEQRELSNRDVLQVVGRHADGRLQARLLDEQGRPGASVLLPGDYVERNVELAYAGTTHAAQGRTLDECQPVVREGIARQELYVMLSRGRGNSTAWVCTERPQADLRPETAEKAGDGAERQRATSDRQAPGADQDLDEAAPGTAAAAPADSAADGARDGADQQRSGADRSGDEADLRDPLGVLAQIMETDQADETATERMALEADRVTHMAHLGGMWTSELKEAIADRTTQALAAILPEDINKELSKDPARGSVMTAVRRAVLAGHDLDQTITRASAEGWKDVRSVGQVLSARVEKIIGTGEASAESWTRITPTGITDDDGFVRQLAREMDARVLELGERAAADPPDYLVERLGEPPAEIMGRTEWVQRAGRVQAYREQYGNTDSPTALPSAPERHSPEQRAAWMAASAALGRTASEREICGARDGQLWVWRSDYERAATWAPPHVGGELGRVYREITDRRRQVVLDEARARHLQGQDPDSAEAQRLLTRAVANDALVRKAEQRRDRLEEVQAQREAWHEHTEALRNRAMAADAELHRRHEDLDLPPLHRPEGEPDRTEAEEERPGVVEKIKGQVELLGRSVRQWAKDGLLDQNEPEPEPERAGPQAEQGELALGLPPAPERRNRRAEHEPAQPQAPEVGQGQQELFGDAAGAAGVGGESDLDRGEQGELERRSQEQVRSERARLWAHEAERAERPETEAVQEELDLGLAERTQDSWLDRALEQARQAREILRRAADRATGREAEAEERRQDGERYRDHLARREEQEIERRRERESQEQEKATDREEPAREETARERAMRAAALSSGNRAPQLNPKGPAQPGRAAAPPPPGPHQRKGPGLSL